MKAKHLIAAALAAATLAVPAAAYPIRTTGHTHATPRLAADILTTIGRYSKATGGCSFVHAAHMEPVSGSAVRSSYTERWTVSVCGAKQRFRIAMWPSPRGGSDFAVTPLTGRLPLHTR